MVTGGSDGIGLACVKRLVEANCRVALLGRSEEKINRALDDVGADFRGQLLPVLGDVTDTAARERLITATKDSFGSVDILVNNAGGGSVNKTLDTIDEQDFDYSISLNLSSAFALCRLVTPDMRLAEFGRIINIASLAGRDASLLAGPQYAAAKAGMIGMSRQLSRELAPFGITVNSVAPGVTETARVKAKWDRLPSEERKKQLSRIPVGRLGHPDEVARAVLYFAGPDSGFTTGACLDVNGGMYRA